TTSGQVHIKCPTGKNIVVTAPFCTITIPPQTKGSVSFDNIGEGAEREVEVTANVKVIHYTQTAGCTHGAGTTTDGIYEGTVVVWGETHAGEQKGVWTTH
ncbi:MAG TPA: hypothetical protein VM656_00365, partial [Pyrinomonadaceae bacterium]|nr:hypothetical protein [Pyrinomonadaceae bacterium]